VCVCVSRPSGLNSTEAFSALVAVYFRAMWRATALGGPQVRSTFSM
jgi:hypothetical protein